MKSRSGFEHKIVNTSQLKQKIDELRTALAESGINTVSKQINDELRLTQRREKEERKVVEQIRACYVRNMKKLAFYYETKIIDITERHRLETRRLEALAEQLERGETVDYEVYVKLKSENKKLENQVRDLTKRLDALEAENNLLKETVTDLKHERNSTKKEFRDCQRELYDYKDRMESKSDELKELKKQIELMKRNIEDKERRYVESESSNIFLENKFNRLKANLEKMRKSRDEIEKRSYEKEKLFQQQQDKLSDASRLLRDLEKENELNTQKIIELIKKSKILGTKNKDIERQLENERRNGAKYLELIESQHDEISENLAMLDKKDAELAAIRSLLLERNNLMKKVEQQYGYYGRRSDCGRSHYDILDSINKFKQLKSTNQTTLQSEQGDHITRTVDRIESKMKHFLDSSRSYLRQSFELCKVANKIRNRLDSHNLCHSNNQQSMLKTNSNPNTAGEIQSRCVTKHSFSNDHSIESFPTDLYEIRSCLKNIQFCLSRKKQTLITKSLSNKDESNNLSTSDTEYFSFSSTETTYETTSSG